LRPARCLKAVQKSYDLKGLRRRIAVSGTPRTGEKKGRNSGAKSDNRGATGWLRQPRSIPRVPHLSEVMSCRICCEFGNFFAGRVWSPQTPDRKVSRPEGRWQHRLRRLALLRRLPEAVRPNLARSRRPDGPDRRRISAGPEPDRPIAATARLLVANGAAISTKAKTSKASGGKSR